MSPSEMKDYLARALDERDSPLSPVLKTYVRPLADRLEFVDRDTNRVSLLSIVVSDTACWWRKREKKSYVLDVAAILFAPVSDGEKGPERCHAQCASVLDEAVAMLTDPKAGLANPAKGFESTRGEGVAMSPLSYHVAGDIENLALYFDLSTSVNSDDPDHHGCDVFNFRLSNFAPSGLTIIVAEHEGKLIRHEDGVVLATFDETCSNRLGEAMVGEIQGHGENEEARGPK